jgi:hypothetical protein
MLLTKVIYSDGSTGMVRTSRLDKLVKASLIASYESFNRWVEVRRKSRSTFNGEDRRQVRKDRFYEGFQL